MRWFAAPSAIFKQPVQANKLVSRLNPPSDASDWLLTIFDKF
jgi:hypothetical protein